MFALAAGKARTGQALDNPVLATEGRVTPPAPVLAGLVLNAGTGWWWADPAAGYALVYCAGREVREIFTVHRSGRRPTLAGRRGARQRRGRAPPCRRPAMARARRCPRQARPRFRR